MQQLSQLTAAGRADLLPGYIVSQLRLEDLAAIEEHAEQRFRAMIAAADAVATEAARPVLHALADEYLAAGNLLFGMIGLDTLLNGNELAGLMVFLSLRREHPFLTRPAAEYQLTADNAAPVTRLLRESLGVDSKPPDPDDEPDDTPSATPPQPLKPIDWKHLCAIAQKRGVPAERFGKMTYLQLDATLRPNGGAAELTREDRRQKRKAKRLRLEMFDALCAEMAITPVQLGIMDTADVAAAVLRTGKMKEIPHMEGLAKHIVDYVAERTKSA